MNNNSGKIINIILQCYKDRSNKKRINIIKIVYNLIFNLSFKAHVLVYYMLRIKNKFFKTLIYNRLQTKYSIWLSPEAKIGDGLHMMHFLGIVIGSGVVIGNNCTIYQQVTIGKEKGKFPKIGDNVIIYSGAKILGGVTIGDNSIIGANAVVITDVPENSIAVGVPARIIYRK